MRQIVPLGISSETSPVVSQSFNQMFLQKISRELLQECLHKLFCDFSRKVPGISQFRYSERNSSEELWRNS